MTYLVKFNNWLVKPNGNRTLFLRNKETKKFTSRKAVFDFLDHINEIQTKRWSYAITLTTPDQSGDRIECTDIEILEPQIEEIGKSPDGKRKLFKKTGMKVYTPGLYKLTFCRICGRLLTDPLSVARGIGPECIKTVGVH